MEYGTQFNITNYGGVIKQEINLLEPNTTYYFRVRAGNGCAAGNWGNTMTIKTTSSSKLNKVFYKNIFVIIKQKVINKLLPCKEKVAKQEIVPVNQIPVPTPKLEQIKTKHIEHEKKCCILWWCLRF